jgi:hypothetical protein
MISFLNRHKKNLIFTLIVTPTSLGFCNTALIGNGGVSKFHNTDIETTSPNFGDYITQSKPGMYKVSNGGTPGIALNFSSKSGRWESHPVNGIATEADGGDGGLQLDGATLGSSHSITFTPKPGVSVILKSFDLIGDTAGENPSFAWQLNELKSSKVLKKGRATWSTDQSPIRPVTINFQGAPGKAIKLTLTRKHPAKTNDERNLHLDNLTFAQHPPAQPARPVSPALMSFGGVTLILKK